MERVVWKGRLLPGKEQEYERRHRDIWPEMVELFREAGIQNYTIWRRDTELFGYYECESPDFAAAVKQKSDAMRRWQASMSALMQLEPGEPFRRVFTLE